MKNIINLSIIYFKQTLSQFFRSKKRTSTLSNTFFMLAIFVIVMLAMGFAYMGSAEQFSAIGHPEYVLVIGLMLSAFLVLMMTVYDSQNQYYKNKDYDLLASLPIKNYSIITAKYLSSYFVSFFYGLLVAFPAYVVYFIVCPLNIVAIIYSILSLFFIPTFTQLIGSILAYIVSLITYKMTNKKIVSNILTVVLTIGLIAFIYIGNSNLMRDLFIGGFPLWIKIVFPHIFLLFSAITAGSFLDFFFFIAITMAFAMVSIGIITIGYKKINSSLSSSSTKKKNKPLIYRTDKPFSSLLRKEAKTFFNSPTYFINAIIGPIMVIILSISMGIGAKDVFGTDASFPSEFFATMYICFSSMCLGIGVPTSASISIEGQKFYTLKSLPISINKILNTKLFFNLILSLPFVLVGSTIYVCIAPCSVCEIVLAYLIPLLSMVTFSVLGLLCNLKWPKLNWTSESQAVKQSLSLFASMMISMLISLLPFILYFSLFDEISSVLSFAQYFSIYLAFIVLLLILFTTLLYTYGKKLYRKI